MGLNVDFMVRIEVYVIAGLETCVAFCCDKRAKVRVDQGAGLQLRGTLGGIVGTSRFEMVNVQRSSR